MPDVIKEVLERFPQGGWFVEAGAYNGVLYPGRGGSPTAALEATGRWKGLCVEPNPNAYSYLVKNRRCGCSNSCLGPRDGEMLTFRMVAGDHIELSGLTGYFGDRHDRETREHEDKRVWTKKLATVLDLHNAPPVIEFLCLDTEGSELAILEAHDFAKFRFLAMLVEHNDVPGRREALVELLGPKGYDREWDDGVNLFFVDKEREKFL